MEDPITGGNRFLIRLAPNDVTKPNAKFGGALKPERKKRAEWKVRSTQEKDD